MTLVLGKWLVPVIARGIGAADRRTPRHFGHGSSTGVSVRFVRQSGQYIAANIVGSVEADVELVGGCHI
jgi:hypothetical protein